LDRLRPRRFRVEERRRHFVERGRLLPEREDLPKVLVDGREVVDDENPSIWLRVHCATVPSTPRGMLRVKVAPVPQPSLWAWITPPSARAARAAPCRPKP